MRTETRQGVPLLRVDDEGAALSTSEDALTLVAETYGGDAETIVVPVGRLDPEFFGFAPASRASSCRSSSTTASAS